MNRQPAEIPGALYEAGQRAIAAIESAGGLEEGLRTPLLRVVACSPFAGRVLERYPDILPGLAESGRLLRPGRAGEMAELLRAGLDGAGAEEEFLQRLRMLRHRELVRIIWRDVNAAAGTVESLRDLSDLADAAIVVALERATTVLQARHGIPCLESGEPCGFGVLGMGKLGGFELNFSSDVDLVFVYSDTGETNGPRPVSNEEYFRGLGRKLVDLLSQQTADGFVYRVDVRLRPFGDSGPLAVSLPGLENYLMRHGRDWERYAYIKARVVNDWADAGYFYRDVVRPFVYRRYLDYGVFSSLREMKAMIEAEVQRKEYQDNVKLGPGGIREIEFIVQSFQLVRGGSVAELQGREILGILPALSRHGCLPEDVVAQLTAAYLFLRRVENAIQAINDQQAHMIPDDGMDRLRVAVAMGYEAWEPLSAELQQQRGIVSGHFRDILLRGESPAVRVAGPDLRQVWLEEVPPEVAAEQLRQAGYADPAAILESLRQLRAAGALQRLGATGRQRLDELMPALLESAARKKNPQLAVQGLAQVIAAIGGRSAYFALLNENPGARDRLADLCATSDFLARQVAAHPLLLDELLDPRLFSNPPTREELSRELGARLSPTHLQDQGQDKVQDHERWLDALRNFQQAALFRIAVADLSGVLPLMKVSDRLTETAELVLAAAVEQSLAEMTARHGQPRCVVDGVERQARFGIVAYGKLGGLELGYSSDLDLVFLHDSAGEEQYTDGEKQLENAAFFVRVARRIISIVTMLTSAGHLYEVDTRLQPEGKKGLLVSSLGAFETYQRDSAWTWEHQALLRSRAVAGSAEVRQAFEDIRRRVLTEHVRRDKLREDVLGMRRKMLDELAEGTADSFHIKQDPGGIMDIEFMVQYLVLREAGGHPQLLRYSDNIRQLEGLAASGIISGETAALLTDIYRAYRQRLHHLTLAGEPGFMPRAEAADSIAAVRRTWEQVFA